MLGTLGDVRSLLETGPIFLAWRSLGLPKSTSFGSADMIGSDLGLKWLGNGLWF
jgi:hypothetical protein